MCRYLFSNKLIILVYQLSIFVVNLQVTNTFTWRILKVNQKSFESQNYKYSVLRSSKDTNDDWSDDVTTNPMLSSIFLQEPKWFRRRDLSFTPSGVVSSAFRSDTFDNSTNLMSPNIRRLALFPFDDGQAFPTGTFPLNIFVMKFRMMMNDIYGSNDKLFGIVCSDGRDGLCSVGTSVEIVDRKLLDDGRQILSTVCRSRFKIINIVQEEPYIIAEVDYDVPDLDIYMIKEGIQVEGSYNQNKKINQETKNTTANISASLSSSSSSSSSSSPQSAVVTGDLPKYLQDLEKEVYQALRDVIQLASSIKSPFTTKNNDQEESSSTSSRIDQQLPQVIQDLSPIKHPYLRLNIATEFSFALCDMIGGTTKLKQLLLESETLELRLYRLRNVLISSRNYLYSQLQDDEPFG